MPNLMITHGGALGDNGFAVPALTELRMRYDEIYLYGRRQALLSLGNTGLVDRFIVRPDDWDNMGKDRRRWLENATADVDFQVRLNFNGVVPGRYMFHKDDTRFWLPVEWKRVNAAGVSFFDAMSERAKMPEAMGKRPITRLTHQERSWLRDFRYIYNIPKDAFLLGWQFTGSARIKWYPFFDEVIQKGIMRKYPQVYVVGLGDLKNKLIWSLEYHGGRYINLGDSVSFRQAYILTSVLDLLVAPETGIMVFSQAYEHVPKILLASHTDGTHICCGNETTILQPDCDCSPCYNIVFDCKHDGSNPWSLCMGKIPPEKVIAAIEEIVDGVESQDN